jgi:hypothetical protein
MEVKVTTHPIRQQRSSRFRTKTRVYVHPTGETVLENFKNRRSRPLNTCREALRTGLSALGVDLSRVDYKWSQKAGCSCGCSPGFIVDGWDAAIAGKNVWVEINSL